MTTGQTKLVVGILAGVTTLIGAILWSKSNDKKSEESTKTDNK